MGWLDEYDLYLFDMDGLLVDTEPLHFEAYKLTLKNKGYILDWTLSQYLSFAHRSSTALKEEITKQFPKILKDASWEDIYRSKQKIYSDLALKRDVTMMEGAKEILARVKRQNKISCVVTNSPSDHVKILIQKSDDLKLIDQWIVREDYKRAKPDPSCYLLAIEKFGANKKCIGFEDSKKGVMALCQTPAQPVWICEKNQKEIDFPKEVLHFSSLKLLLQDNGL